MLRDLLKSKKEWLWLLPALLLGVYLLVRNLRIWDLYSVDVLYWDQWDFWRQMFVGDSGPWDMFNHQHGPHKMGVGYFFLYVVAELSGWNLRVESFALILVSALTTGVFLFLKRKLVGCWGWSDVVVPVMCLSFAHYEIYFIGTNPGLNVLPLLLVAVIAVCIGADDSVARYVWLAVLGFAATYTGFALFAGLLVPVYCFAEGLRSARAGKAGWIKWRPFLAALVSGVGFWSFFWDYRFMPAAPDFKFPHDPFWEYGPFISRYWAHFFNLGSSGVWLLVLAVATLSVVGLGIWRGLSRGGNASDSLSFRRRDVVAFLCLFSLLYSVNVAVGRIGINLDAGMVSRYLTFLVPLWFGGYLLILELGPRLRFFASICLLVLLVWADRSFERSRIPELERLAAGKRAWVEAYLETRDIVRANEMSGFKIYPFDWAYAKQEEYIDLMEREGLGFVRNSAK